MASSSHPKPGTSSSQLCTCDVFLSFRGEDTRKTFVDHLYSALVDRKVLTYKDDEKLPQGESIRPSLFNAIKGSQIAVIIFSKNYADSSWCLEELAYIMKCKNKRGLFVMPIFYDVVPSEVRKQQGEFGRGFVKHEAGDINKVESWRKALVDASEIAGWEPKNIANGHESKLIKEIVDTISDKLFLVNSCVDEDLVGMNARLQELEAQLDIGSHGVSMVGVWGVGGSGKTTLASSLYMKISCHFQSHCFIDNIREESSKHGLKTLQENLLSRLLNTEMKLQGVEEGKHMLRSRLNHSNVLILLDDVDDCKQLDALAGSHNWFGSGSRIIITTRDEHLLRTHKVDLVCPITLLSHEEAVMLFTKHAYNKNTPINDYEMLSSHVVSYAAGLPLALKVLGSFLYDKNENEWLSSLSRLKDIPEIEIVEKLKISYDGLKNIEKELFLDIACFFRGESTESHTTNNYYGSYDAMEVFEACGYHPNVGIKVLRQKALITIVNGRFDMHDLVQEMGHYIVRGEHPNNPEKHSRVWKCEEILNMFFGDATMENDRIEAIRYHPDHHDYDHLSRFCKIVSNMKKLRYLSVTIPDKKYDQVGPNFLSNELRYIHWKNYPESPFPDTFQPMKLVDLKMSKSLQKELWEGYKYLPHMKVLQLYDMRNIVSTPDFNGLPCLQKLTLSKCSELREIHPSLGCHMSLEYVRVFSCYKLRKFPRIVQMRKLETLEIEYCDNTLKFPEIQSKMESLIKLSLRCICIDALLSSIGEQCARLISLDLVHCSILKSIEADFDGLQHLEAFTLYGLTRLKPQDQLCISWLVGKVGCGKEWYTSEPSISLWLTHSLRKLDLCRCGLQDGEVPSNIDELYNLQELHLGWNDFKRLDTSLSQLTRLKFLTLNGCKQLIELPKLPSSISILIADNCDKLKAVGDFHKNCKWLRLVSLIDGSVIIDGDRLLESMLKGNAIENHSMKLSLQGYEIAKGYIPPLLRGSRCTLKLPDNWCNDFSGFLICFTLKHKFLHRSIRLSMEHMKSDTILEDCVVWEVSDNDKFTQVWYISFGSLRHTRWWDETSNVVSVSINVSCEGFGVRLVERGIGSGPRETSTNYNDEFYYSRFRFPHLHESHDLPHVLEISL